MKRYPRTTRYRPPGPGAYQVMPRAVFNPQNDGEALDAFLVSGGATVFLTSVAPAFDARLQGVQLLAAQYVPAGRVGWIKQIRVAPYCPSQLAAPWQGWPGTWQQFDPVIGGAFGAVRATAQCGVYTTPMGWESYYGSESESLTQWEWMITLLSGTIEQSRQGLPAFSVSAPASWFLVRDVPVPKSAYPNGLPGVTPTDYGPQRMQVLQGDELTQHLRIPQNTTALLWARWLQTPIAPIANDANNAPFEVGDPIYPLLPSFGQMLGYTQAIDRPAALQNGRYGWNG